MPVIVEEEGETEVNAGKENGVVSKGGTCPMKAFTNGTGPNDDAIRVASPASSLSESDELKVVSKDDKDGPSVQVTSDNGEVESSPPKVSGTNGDTQEDMEQEKTDGESATENNGFRVISLKLVLPGVSETMDIVAIAKDAVNDLFQYAFEKPESCYRTCLGVYFKGKRIDNFVELGSVEGLESGSTLELVEVPYALRDVVMHVQRLQELVMSSSNQQPFASSSAACQSVSLLRQIIDTDLEDSDIPEPAKDFTGLDPPLYCLPPNNPPTADGTLPPLMESSTLLSQFYPKSNTTESKEPVSCVKLLAYSPWNPPTPNRKMKGDLLYLDVTTLEGDRICITANPSGFFVNRTVVGEVFDPQPKKASHFAHHLLTLLQQVSPLFKKNFATIQKLGEKRHVFEVFPIPYPVYSWVVPKRNYRSQTFQIDNTMGLVVMADELLVGQLRDWNEELQSAKELPVDSVQERVYRDRALFKVHSDFVQLAVKGAVAAVDGQLHPLNPADSVGHHMYLWNNIFFGTGFDGKGHLKEFGGDEAGHTAANYDLQGVEILEKLGIKGLYTLGAVLVDYKGFRVFCQSIVPGLLQKEQGSSIIYGSMDNGKTFTKNDKFNELMVKVGKELNLRPHKIISNSSDEVIDVPVSVEVKGIQGNDGRQYALDMFRILPPDAIYADSAIVNGEVESSSERPTANKLGLRHKLYLLRRELVDSYIGTMALQLHLMSVQKIMKKKEEDMKKKEETTAGTNGDSSTSNGTNKREESTAEEGRDDHQENGNNASSDDTSENTQQLLDETTSTDTPTTSMNTPTTLTDTPTVSADMPTASIGTSSASTQTDASTTSTGTSTASTGTSTASTGTSTASTGTSTASTGTSTVSTGTSTTTIGTSTVSTGTSTATTGTSIASTGAVTTSLQDSTVCPVSGVSGVSSSDIDPSKGIKPSKTSDDSLMNILVFDGLELMGEKMDVPELSVPNENLDVLAAAPSSPLHDSSILKSSDNEETTIDEQDSSTIKLLHLYEDFSIMFNPDIFTAGLKSSEDEETLKKDRQRCIHLSQYLTLVVIPKFIKECLFLSAVPLDGVGLATQMHARGINMRYLGRIASVAVDREDLQHLYRICVSEMILRVSKRKLRRVLVDSPRGKVASNIAHFLNCLLSEHEEKNSAVVDESTSASSKKKHKKKKNPPKEGAGQTSGSGLKSGSGSVKESLTVTSLWKWIKDDVELHYRYALEFSSVSDTVKACNLQRTTLLREFCKKMGIQIYVRDYNYATPTPFTDDDIIALVPVVKHTQYRPLEVSNMYDLAFSRLDTGNFKFAHELLTEAIQLSLQIYGPMHTDIAKCYKLLGRIHYLAGEITLAVGYQHKATLMYERLLGVDHCTTISAYYSLAQYCVQATRAAVALKLFYRVKYLTVLAHGHDHPEVANIDFQIAVCLCNLKQYPTALTFLYNALHLQMKYYGRDCIPMGISHTLAAHAFSQIEEYREALRHEKTAFGIFCERLGPDHEKTKKSSECLKVLTEKAVFVQKQKRMVTDLQTASDQVKGQSQQESGGKTSNTGSKTSSRSSSTSGGGGIPGKRKTKPNP